MHKQPKTAAIRGRELFNLVHNYTADSIEFDAQNAAMRKRWIKLGKAVLHTETLWKQSKVVINQQFGPVGKRAPKGSHPLPTEKPSRSVVITESVSNPGCLCIEYCEDGETLAGHDTIITLTGVALIKIHRFIETGEK